MINYEAGMFSTDITSATHFTKIGQFVEKYNERHTHTAYFAFLGNGIKLNTIITKYGRFSTKTFITVTYHVLTNYLIEESLPWSTVILQ
jgi:hypothetical protein